MKKTVVVVGTLDTKGEEFAFIKDLIEKEGLETLVVDYGVMGEAQYPTILPNWNNKTEKFFKTLGINLGTSKLKVRDKYKLLSEAFKYLEKIDPQQDFFTLNHSPHTLASNSSEIVRFRKD